jgi:5'-deoxynucleotidase YfbR-like HD superfamily hydrolase
VTNKNLNDKLNSAYVFMVEAYNGNWKYRWGSTPYFDADKTGKAESVVAHEWACGLFWLTLRRICPALDSAVNSTEVYERLFTHDLGETHLGDISRFQQLQGQGANKGKTEHEAIHLMVETVDAATRQTILNWFDEFEEKPDQMEKLEVLVAKFVDSLQGDHFCLTFGHDLPSHSEPISKIVNKHTVPFAKRLMEVLEKSGYHEAKEEVRQIFHHHIKEIQAAGITLETGGYPE